VLNLTGVTVTLIQLLLVLYCLCFQPAPTWLCYERFRKMDFMRNVVFDAAKTTIYGPPGAPEDSNAQANASSRHPVAFMFHLLFKCSAFALYFFGSLFGMNVTVMYVTTILLLAFDFWTVKVRLLMPRHPRHLPLCLMPFPLVRRT
jgi:hypothetical protein